MSTLSLSLWKDTTEDEEVEYIPQVQSLQCMKNAEKIQDLLKRKNLSEAMRSNYSGSCEM